MNTHPSQEAVVEELDNLANIYGWHKDACCGHSHHPACPVVKLRRMIIDGFTTYAHTIREEAVKSYIKGVILDFHKSRLNGAPGYDFFFKLSTDLDALTPTTNHTGDANP